LNVYAIQRKKLQVGNRVKKICSRRKLSGFRSGKICGCVLPLVSLYQPLKPSVVLDFSAQLKARHCHSTLYCSLSTGAGFEAFFLRPPVKVQRGILKDTVSF
jgi:hypothetical protein